MHFDAEPMRRGDALGRHQPPRLVLGRNLQGVLRHQRREVAGVAPVDPVNQSFAHFLGLDHLRRDFATGMPGLVFERDVDPEFFTELLFHGPNEFGCIRRDTCPQSAIAKLGFVQQRLELGTKFCRGARLCLCHGSPWRRGRSRWLRGRTTNDHRQDRADGE